MRSRRRGSGPPRKGECCCGSSNHLSCGSPDSHRTSRPGTPQIEIDFFGGQNSSWGGCTKLTSQSASLAPKFLHPMPRPAVRASKGPLRVFPSPTRKYGSCSALHERQDRSASIRDGGANPLSFFRAGRKYLLTPIQNRINFILIVQACLNRDEAEAGRGTSEAGPSVQICLPQAFVSGS